MSDEIDDRVEPPKRTFDRFDGRGTHLAELLIFVQGPAIERAVLAAHGVKVRFVPKKRLEARWFANDLHLLPALPQQGDWFASVEVRGLGPAFSETYWTLRFAVVPDDAPPEEMRQHAFPGAFPDNLPALLHLGQIDGAQSVRVRARYFTRRDRIPSTVDAIAPWLASSPPHRELVPRQTTWHVAGYRALTQVCLQETDYEGAIWLKAHATLQTVISAASLDAIDAVLWADLTTFLAASDRRIVRTETHEPA
jgi:hypothetical protein